MTSCDGKKKAQETKSGETEDSAHSELEVERNSLPGPLHVESL